MTDLIIDGSIAAAVCLGKNSEAKELIESRESSHLRNWIYVGQKVEIYELLIDDIKMQDKYQYTVIYCCTLLNQILQKKGDVVYPFDIAHQI